MFYIMFQRCLFFCPEPAVGLGERPFLPFPLRAPTTATATRGSGPLRTPPDNADKSSSALGTTTRIVRGLESTHRQPREGTGTPPFTPPQSHVPCLPNAILCTSLSTHSSYIPSAEVACQMVCR